MKLHQEAIRYLSIGYAGLPDKAAELRDAIDKASLYFRWGQESGEKDDYMNAFAGFNQVADEKLNEAELLDKYEKLLLSHIEIMRIELKDAVELFNFLCDNRMRIELRGIAFRMEVDVKINLYMDREEELQTLADKTKAGLLAGSLNDEHKDKRKKILEKFDREKEHINKGIEAFYNRIKEYISK